MSPAVLATTVVPPAWPGAPAGASAPAPSRRLKLPGRHKEPPQLAAIPGTAVVAPLPPVGPPAAPPQGHAPKPGIRLPSFSIHRPQAEPEQPQQASVTTAPAPMAPPPAASWPAMQGAAAPQAPAPQAPFAAPPATQPSAPAPAPSQSFPQAPAPFAAPPAFTAPTAPFAAPPAFTAPPAQPFPQVPAQPSAPFAQAPAPFGQAPAPFGQAPAPFGQAPAPFAPAPAPFAQAPAPFAPPAAAFPPAPTAPQAFASQPTAMPAFVAPPVAVPPPVVAPGRTRRAVPHPHLPRPHFRALDPRPAFADRGAFYSVRPLGYFTALLLLGLAVVGAAIAYLASDLVVSGIADANLDSIREQLAGDTGKLLAPLAVVFAGLAAVTLFTFSIVVSVSTHNAPSLGAEPGSLLPSRALRSWANVLWAQGRVAVAWLLPVWLFTIGWGVVGGILALVFLERLQRNLDDIGGWLTKPSRHLVEMYDRLGLKGGRSRLAAAWKASFVIANALMICAWGIPAAIAAAGQISPMATKLNIPGASSETVLVAGRAALLAVAWGAAIATLIAIVLLVPITIGLVQRQQTRRILVLAGLSRPWMQPGTLLGAMPQPAAPMAPAPFAEVSGDDIATYETIVPAPGPAVTAGVPRWRQHETTRTTTAPMASSDWLDRLKADQIRAERQRTADEAAAAELIAQAQRTGPAPQQGAAASDAAGQQEAAAGEPAAAPEPEA